MKTLVFFCFALLISNLTSGQTFHFVDTSTTLIKNTDQSPAHWYLEVYNDVGVDTTLRWKASFQNIPAAWDVQLDDQDNTTTNIQDGDSADFTLFTGLPFPQKLIIGVTFNGVPGSGSVYFDIYDPNDPSVVQRIQYRFIVSAVGIEELDKQNFIFQKGEKILFDEQLVGSDFKIFLENGRTAYESTVQHEMTFPSLEPGQLFFVVVDFKGQLYRKKFIAK